MAFFAIQSPMAATHAGWLAAIMCWLNRALASALLRSPEVAFESIIPQAPAPEAAPQKLLYLGPAAFEDVMREQFDFLMSHYIYCARHGCDICARFCRLRAVLVRPVDH